MKKKSDVDIFDERMFEELTEGTVLKFKIYAPGIRSSWRLSIKGKVVCCSFATFKTVSDCRKNINAFMKVLNENKAEYIIESD